jgi:hypothetical protein
MEGNPWIQKVVGLAAAWIVALAAQKAGVHLSEAEVAGLIVTVLSTVEFFISKKYNPGNSSSAHLAAKEFTEVAKMKNG